LEILGSLINLEEKLRSDCIMKIELFIDKTDIEIAEKGRGTRKDKVTPGTTMLVDSSDVCSVRLDLESLRKAVS